MLTELLCILILLLRAGSREAGAGGGSELAAVIFTDLTWLCPPASPSECALWVRVWVERRGRNPVCAWEPTTRKERGLPHSPVPPRTKIFPSSHLLRARGFLCFDHWEGSFAKETPPPPASFPSNIPWPGLTSLPVYLSVAKRPWLKFLILSWELYML